MEEEAKLEFTITVNWASKSNDHPRVSPNSLPDFISLSWVAVAVVAIELGVIAWIRKRYMDTPLLQAIFQVVLGGILVFLTGILISSFGS
jgi:hypothetical protein